MGKKMLVVAMINCAANFSSFAGTASLVLAQAGGGGNLDAAMGKGLGIIYKVAYVIAVICIMSGGWSIRKGEADTGKMAIVGGFVIGLAGVITQALFSAGGVPVNIQIQQ